jgi:hypothetical protein
MPFWDSALETLREAWDALAGLSDTREVGSPLEPCSDGADWHACGILRLTDGAQELKAASRDAFPNEDNTLRDKEAEQISKKLLDTWNRNYGKGNNTSRDNVGGYLCWDWSKAFTETVHKMEPKYWIAEQKMVHKRDSNVVHFFMELRPRGANRQEGVRYIDDGWFDGEFVHSPPWPPSEDWTPGAWMPPPEKYGKPPIDSGSPTQ